MTVFNALVLRWRSKLGDPERRLAFNVATMFSLLTDRLRTGMPQAHQTPPALRVAVPESRRGRDGDRAEALVRPRWGGIRPAWLYVASRSPGRV